MGVDHGRLGSQIISTFRGYWLMSIMIKDREHPISRIAYLTRGACRPSQKLSFLCCEIGLIHLFTGSRFVPTRDRHSPLLLLKALDAGAQPTWAGWGLVNTNTNTNTRHYL